MMDKRGDRFPQPDSPDQPEDLSPVDVEGDAVDRLHDPVAGEEVGAAGR